MNDPYGNDVTGVGSDRWNDLDLWDADQPSEGWRKPNRMRRSSARRDRAGGPGNRRDSRRSRVEAADGTFRCRKCKTMVGPPISGGRHRNHCPLCLYSRHVDRSRPGDRLSDCRSMMMPVGLVTRHDGKQMLVHECLGCGAVRRNRVAADDNTLATTRLPVLPATASAVDAGVERSAS